MSSLTEGYGYNLWKKCLNSDDQPYQQYHAIDTYGFINGDRVVSTTVLYWGAFKLAFAQKIELADGYRSQVICCIKSAVDYTLSPQYKTVVDTTLSPLIKP
jgi:hypothetical protein